MLARIMLGCVLVAAIASSAAAQSQQANLPRLIEDLKSADDKVRTAAIATLASMGPDARPAAPALIEAAVQRRGHADTLLALAKIDTESTHKALRQLLVGGIRRCKCGISFNEVIAAAGEPMVPHLIALLPEKEIAANAEATLVKIGEPAVPHLIRALQVRCPQPIQLSAYRTLTQIGPKAKAATAVLESHLANYGGAVKVRAAQTLCVINGSHAKAFDVIHDAVKSDDRPMKMEALQVLVELRAASQELIPTMLAIFAADDQHLYSNAMSVMLNVGKPGVPALIGALAKNDAAHSTYIMYTLNNLGPVASAAVPTFTTILEGKDRGLAILAAECMPNFGPDAKQAIPHLLTALKSDDPTMRRASAQALARIDAAQIPHTIAPLVATLRGNNAMERIYATNLLRTFGASAKPAIPALLDLLKTENLNARVGLVQALTTIDKDQIDAGIPTLIEVLRAPGRATGQHRVAIQMLTAAGPRAKSAAPVLKDHLRAWLKGDGSVSPNSVLHCLKKIDAAHEIVPVLIEALNSEKRDDREEARYVALDHVGIDALQPLEAALANGELRGSAEVTGLLTDLRKRVRN